MEEASGSVIRTRSVVVACGGFTGDVDIRPSFLFPFRVESSDFVVWDNTDHKYSNPLLFVDDERRVIMSVGEIMIISAKEESWQLG